MPTNPLVRVAGLQELMQREQEAPSKVKTLDGDALESALAGHFRLAWSHNKLGRFRIEEQLIRDLRARRGEYGASELGQLQQATNGGLNIVWAPLTETKCRAASAWIREIVLPVGEQPWGMDPSPLADLPMAVKKTIVAAAVSQAQQVMQQANAAGGGIPDVGEFRDMVVQLGDKLKAQAEKEIAKAAKDRASKMELVIADRLLDGGYYEAMDAFVEDFVTYPAAHLKGPFYTNKMMLEWGPDWEVQIKTVPVQTWKHVSAFDAYPAPAATSPQRGNFIERERYRRDELAALRGLPGYKDEQINDCLEQYTNGHLEAWLWTESERQRLQQQTTWCWLSPPDVIDVLNCWGSVPGWKLKSWGVEGIDDDYKDYECNVMLCGRFVLYAALNPHPLNQRPYHKACYDEIPGAYWGRSIPGLARPAQQFCNAAACALADNLSIASGPQAWVHIDRLADGEQSLELFPWKVWQLKSQADQGTNPGVGFFMPDDRSAELLKVYEFWELKADDATGIPRYSYGNENVGGSADTASGLSMLMNNAAKGLRRAISSIDLNVIAMTISQTFVYEMMYNPDHSIKGDNVIVPRGAAAILIRESAQQRRLQFLTLTANPIDAPIIGQRHRAALLRQTAAALELPVDEVVPSDEEIVQNMAAAAQQQTAMLQAQMQAQAQKEAAIGQRESQAQSTQAIADIVKAAITKAMGSPGGAQPAGAPAAPELATT